MPLSGTTVWVGTGCDTTTGWLECGNGRRPQLCLISAGTQGLCIHSLGDRIQETRPYGFEQDGSATQRLLALFPLPRLHAVVRRTWTLPRSAQRWSYGVNPLTALNQHHFSAGASSCADRSTARSADTLLVLALRPQAAPVPTAGEAGQLKAAPPLYHHHHHHQQVAPGSGMMAETNSQAQWRVERLRLTQGTPLRADETSVQHRSHRYELVPAAAATASRLHAALLPNAQHPGFTDSTQQPSQPIPAAKRPRLQRQGKHPSQHVGILSTQQGNCVWAAAPAAPAAPLGCGSGARDQTVAPGPVVFYSGGVCSAPVPDGLAAAISIHTVALPAALPHPHTLLPGTTCVLCLESWTELLSGQLPDPAALAAETARRECAQEPGMLRGEPVAGACGEGPNAAAAAWLRLPPLQQLALACGCEHAALSPELYRGLLTPSSGGSAGAATTGGITTGAAAASRPTRAAQRPIATASAAASAAADAGLVPADRLPWGCFLVGTDSGRLWACPLDSPTPTSRIAAPAGAGVQGRSAGWDPGTCGAAQLSSGPAGAFLLLDLQEPLVALLPLKGVSRLGAGAAQPGVPVVGSTEITRGTEAGPAEECVVALLVVGARGRVVALSAAPAAKAAADAAAEALRGSVGGGGRVGGALSESRTRLEVLQSFSLLTGTTLRLLRLQEWQLGMQVRSAVLTAGGALVWLSRRGRVMAAQVVASTNGPSAAAGGTNPSLLFCTDLQPLCLPAPRSVRQLSPCHGAVHHVLAVSDDGIAVLLHARMPPYTGDGGWRDAGAARTGVQAASDQIAMGAGAGGCAAGMLAAMARAGGGSGGGPEGPRRRAVLQQQLRQLLGALVRLGNYEEGLRAALAAQWEDFQRATHDLPIARSLVTPRPMLRCRLIPELLLLPPSGIPSRMPCMGAACSPPASSVQLVVQVELLGPQNTAMANFLGRPGPLAHTSREWHLVVRFLPHHPALPSSTCTLSLPPGCPLPLCQRRLLAVPALPSLPSERPTRTDDPGGSAFGSRLVGNCRQLLQPQLQLQPAAGTLQALLIRTASSPGGGNRVGMDLRSAQPSAAVPTSTGPAASRHPAIGACAGPATAVLLLGQQLVGSAVLAGLPCAGALGAGTWAAFGAGVGSVAFAGAHQGRRLGGVGRQTNEGRNLPCRRTLRLLLVLSPPPPYLVPSAAVAATGATGPGACAMRGQAEGAAAGTSAGGAPVPTGSGNIAGAEGVLERPDPSGRPTGRLLGQQPGQHGHREESQHQLYEQWRQEEVHRRVTGLLQRALLLPSAVSSGGRYVAYSAAGLSHRPAGSLEVCGGRAVVSWSAACGPESGAKSASGHGPGHPASVSAGLQPGSSTSAWADTAVKITGGHGIQGAAPAAARAQGGSVGALEVVLEVKADTAPLLASLHASLMAAVMDRPPANQESDRNQGPVARCGSQENGGGCRVALRSGERLQAAIRELRKLSLGMQQLQALRRQLALRCREEMDGRLEEEADAGNCSSWDQGNSLRGVGQRGAGAQVEDIPLSVQMAAQFRGRLQEMYNKYCEVAASSMMLAAQ